MILERDHTFERRVFQYTTTWVLATGNPAYIIYWLDTYG